MAIDPKTARGVRNCNPGNIERVAGVRWQGMANAQTDKRFVVFDAPEWGIRALARVLITYQDKKYAKDGSRIDTIAEIIERWAPATENDVAAYVNAVAKSTGILAYDPIDVYDWHDMRAIVTAIIAHECAGYRYPDAVIDNGLIKAGLKPPRSVVGSATAAVAKTLATAGVVASAAATVAPDVVSSLPAAKDAYGKAVTGMAPLAELVPWLPPLAGLLMVAAVVILAVRNSALRKRLA